MDAKCKCRSCDQPLSFPTEIAGQTIICPHCQTETTLNTADDYFAIVQDKTRSFEERKEALGIHGELSRKQNESDLVKLKRRVQPVDAKCPNCNSENTMKCSVAYQAGTTKGTFSGIGVDLGGDVGAFGGVKTSRTLLADSAAPPRLDTRATASLAFMALLGPAVAFLGIGELLNDSQPRWLFILFVLLGLPASVWGIRGRVAEKRQAKHEHAEALRNWVKRWVCLRCGMKFEPNPE